MKRPPFCPNPKCSYHDRTLSTRQKWFWKRGFSSTKINGRNQCFQCKQCGRYFSERIFHIDYYAKKEIDYRELLNSLKTCSGIRDMARHFHCRDSTIQNRIRRLCVNIIAFWQDAYQYYQSREKGQFAADGLESFTSSQFFPCHINILVGKESQFIYDFSYFFFKRKGRTTQKQRQIIDRLYALIPFEDKPSKRSFRDIMMSLQNLAEQDVTLHTDEHPVYPIVIEELKRSGCFENINHRVTSSQVFRNTSNNLFCVNYIDRQIRKDLAEHVRETVQFARNSNNCMERFVCYSFWHNFQKPFRVDRKKRGFETHAEAAGFDMERLKEKMEDVFTKRSFYSFYREELEGYRKRVWESDGPTPFPRGKRYLARYLVA